MNFRPPKRGRGALINVTSLIDVLFLLLIFFMVTSTFRHQPAINLVLPRSSTAAETVDTPAIVFLTEAGQIFLNETAIPEGGLGRALEQLQAASGEDRIVLRADENASHGRVVELIDIIKESGFTRVSLSARQPAGR